METTRRIVLDSARLVALAITAGGTIADTKLNDRGFLEFEVVGVPANFPAVTLGPEFEHVRRFIGAQEIVLDMIQSLRRGRR